MKFVLFLPVFFFAACIFFAAGCSRDHNGPGQDNGSYNEQKYPENSPVNQSGDNNRGNTRSGNTEKPGHEPPRSMDTTEHGNPAYYNKSTWGDSDTVKRPRR